MNEHTSTSLPVNPHSSEEELYCFYHNTMEPEALLKFLSHSSSCDFCAGRLASYVSENGTLMAPKNLKEAVLNRIESLPLTKVRKRRFLMAYSLKVCGAVCGALFLLVAVSLVQPDAAKTPSKSHLEYQEYLEYTQRITREELAEFKASSPRQITGHMESLLQGFGSSIHDFFN